MIDKKISLVKDYTEIKEFPFIIKSCRLKPYSYVFEKKNRATVLYDWWFDEFGNSLKINNKKVQIIYNDLNLNRERIICTDLYFGLGIAKTFKMSKFAYVAIGKDEDTQVNTYLISFLGLDNYWRSYLYSDTVWTQVSPLMMQFETLRFLAKKHELKYFIKIKNKKNTIVPCLFTEQWITALPASEDFLQILKREQEKLLPILTKGNII